MRWQAAQLIGGTAAIAAGGWALRAVQGAPSALGASPVEIDAVTKGSPNHHDGVFKNLEPSSMLSLTRQEQFLLVRDIVGGNSRQHPEKPIPLVIPAADLPAGDLAVTWYGHSSAVIEIDGYRVLADPMWSDRCSPSRALGPQRLHPVPAPLDALPAIDAVIISHDHYDHLDVDTIKQLARTQRAMFFVPLGIGAHLRAWHIPDDRIVELDWNQSADLGELTLVCTPARHFSGRFLTRNVTLWSSWALIGPRHRAFFVGDAGLLVPIHWGTFRLAPHPWSEPVERTLVAAEGEGVKVAIPRPGQRVEAGPPESHSSRERSSTTLDAWWRA